MDDEQNIKPQPNRLLYWSSVRWATYSTLSAVTLMAKIYPTTWILAACVVLGYFAYMLFDVFKYANEIEHDYGRERAMKTAIVHHGMDICLYLMALVIGLVL